MLIVVSVVFNRENPMGHFVEKLLLHRSKRFSSYDLELTFWWSLIS